MTETKTYTGSCHCGKVRYEVKAAIEKVMSCNCSICGRSGTLLTFVPEDQFKLQSGSDVLTDYQFGRMHIHHTFCSTCGIKSFSSGTAPDGKKMMAINVRCLEGVDPESFPVEKFDGKSL